MTRDMTVVQLARQIAAAKADMAQAAAEATAAAHATSVAEGASDGVFYVSTAGSDSNSGNLQGVLF
jgi:hypothetical protein